MAAMAYVQIGGFRSDSFVAL